MKLSRIFALALSALMALSATLPLRAEEGVLSTDEIEYLYFMREEEKLARDVYLSLYREWGATVFANIALSEQRHTDTVAELIAGYGLTDPVQEDIIGEFVNPELAALYDELMALGRQSLLDALYVGALIEEVDMEDIQHAMDHSDEPEILTVYDNLMRASRNHLRGFVEVLANQGVEDYQAQYIDQAWVDAILAEDTETGE